MNVRTLIEASTPKGNGDCYDVAGRVAIDDHFDTKSKVVHGRVNGQGALEGYTFGHAWIEKGNTVIDKSNGNDVSISKDLYYAIGGIKEYKSYSFKEARKWMLKTGHFGPWEISNDAVFLGENIPAKNREMGKAKQRVPRDLLNKIKDEEL